MSDGMVAFVTEGTAARCSGICRALAEKKYSVSFTYSGGEAEAASLRAEIEALGVRCMAFPVEKFDAPALSNAVIGTAEALGGIDLLVYFGDMPEDSETEGALTLDLDEADWDDAMNRGVRGFFLCCKYALPYLVGKPGARVVAVDTKPHDRGACNLAEFAASRALQAAALRISDETSLYGVSLAYRKMSDDWLAELMEDK
jgi:NAD(P)-dependent dehydrogenase (short-subunit alcohol dehydrogenase family)